MKMKKVLHFISSNGFYGAENVLLELCLGLRASSVHPVVGLLDSGNRGHLPLLRECRKHGLEVNEFKCRGRFDRSLIRELAIFIEKNNIKVIHSHGYKSNFYASLIRQPDLLRVSTCHNWIVAGFKMRCFTWLDKLLLRFFDNVICVSRPVQMELRKWGVKRKHLSLIYNGIDIRRFRRDMDCRNKIRRQLGITDSDIVIGFVGRISKEKGVYILMECAKIVHENFPGARFVFVGDGPSRDELENSGADFMLFAGVQSDVSSWYSAFDIFILPSFTEGLPMVVLEAMASKLPVVASAVGAIPDVVEDGVTGYLISPKEEKSVCNAVEQLIRSSVLATQMGEKGLAKVKQAFSSEIMVQQYISIYDSLA